MKHYRAKPSVRCTSFASAAVQAVLYIYAYALAADIQPQECSSYGITLLRNYN